MEDEFDQLMELFSQSEQDKERKLEEVFQRSMEFFDKYKYILASGSEEEKETIRKKMESLRSKLKDENEKTHQRLGLNPEDVKQIVSDPKNFSPRQWEFLQKAQSQLMHEKKEETTRIQAKKEERIETLKEAKKKKSSTKKSGWLKS